MSTLALGNSSKGHFPLLSDSLQTNSIINNVAALLYTRSVTVNLNTDEHWHTLTHMWYIKLSHCVCVFAGQWPDTFWADMLRPLPRSWGNIVVLLYYCIMACTVWHSICWNDGASARPTLSLCFRSLHRGGSLSSTTASREEKTWWSMHR